MRIGDMFKANSGFETKRGRADTGEGRKEEKMGRGGPLWLSGPVAGTLSIMVAAFLYVTRVELKTGEGRRDPHVDTLETGSREW